MLRRDPTRLHPDPALEPQERDRGPARIRPRVGRAADRPDPDAGGALVKVVLFCGGLGLRMGEESTRLPKPMIPLGDRPILWHIMKYYAELRVPRLRALPRLQGRGDQGLLPQLQRGALERLRAHDGGKRDRAARRATSTTGRSRSWTPGSHSTIGERLQRSPAATSATTRCSSPTTATALTDAPLPDMVDDAEGERQDRALPLRRSPTLQLPRRDARRTAIA